MGRVRATDRTNSPTTEGVPSWARATRRPHWQMEKTIFPKKVHEKLILRDRGRKSFSWVVWWFFGGSFPVT